MDLPGGNPTNPSQRLRLAVYRFTKNRVAFGASLVLLAGLGLFLLTRPRWVPLSSAVPPSSDTQHPICIINAADAVRIVPPFKLASEPSSAAGSVLALPEGKGSDTADGCAELPFVLATAGVYHAWVRVRWADSCGNSLGFQVDAAAETVVGQDAVFGTWHWVQAGAFRLSPGDHRVTLKEREDGVAVDQILLSTDPAFVPSAPIRSNADSIDIRRFADSFNRSPGHGLKHWDFPSGSWEVAFSLDPNRIPNQYSLVGQPETAHSQASAVMQGPPWRGCRVEWSVFPKETCRFGVQFTPQNTADAPPVVVDFTVSQPTGRLMTSVPGKATESKTMTALTSGQWSRVTVERWAWILRILVDDNPLTARTCLTPSSTNIAFFVANGKVLFDDVRVDELPWQAEGDEFRIPWTLSKDASWFRPAANATESALRGDRGTISTALANLPVFAVMLQERSAGDFRLSEGGWLPPHVIAVGKLLTRLTPDPTPLKQVQITPTHANARLSRVAVAYGVPLDDCFRIGPHSFSGPTIPDPSDYLDFTPEEYKAIKASDQADKLTRNPKTIAVLGKKGDYCVWAIRKPSWEVTEGILRGTGPGADLRFWQELSCSLTFRGRILLETARTCVCLHFCHGRQGGATVTLTGPSAPSRAPAAESNPTVPVPHVGIWHDVEVKVTPQTIAARLVGEPWRQHAARDTWGGELRLEVTTGTARFDDIEILVPRRSSRQRFYAFDRRETDWVRTGGHWIDHGGVSCALASNWISLVAPSATGVLWNKLTWSDNVLVAFNIEENSKWFGWEQQPSHVHHPFDNVCVALTPRQDWDKGYRLEVNAEDRTATILYRNGKEVCRVPQDALFPIQFVGGHAPYRPRRNRIRLVKNGDTLEATVNGTPVLAYRDPSPLTVRRVGVGGHHTQVNFSRIVVRSLPP